jgi:hypothetical protein
MRHPRRRLGLLLLTVAALGLAGLQSPGTTHAAVAVVGGLGCTTAPTTANPPTAISFPTSTNSAGGAELSGTQLGAPWEPGVPAALSRSGSPAMASCGGVFEDTDADPATISSGTLHYHVDSGLIIVESNSQDYSLACGSAGSEEDTCQGGLDHVDRVWSTELQRYIPVGRVSPTPGNLVHVKPNPATTTVSQGCITATYTARFNPVLPPWRLNVGKVCLPISN